MPVKRRVDKRRHQYPEAIIRLIEGYPVAFNDESEDAIFNLYFFNEYPELDDPDLHRCAGELIESWHPTRLARPNVNSAGVSGPGAASLSLSSRSPAS